jgi:hypothetical protein
VGEGSLDGDRRLAWELVHLDLGSPEAVIEVKNNHGWQMRVVLVETVRVSNTIVGCTYCLRSARGEGCTSEGSGGGAAFSHGLRRVACGYDECEDRELALTLLKAL